MTLPCLWPPPARKSSASQAPQWQPCVSTAALGLGLKDRGCSQAGQRCRSTAGVSPSPIVCCPEALAAKVRSGQGTQLSRPEWEAGRSAPWAWGLPREGPALGEHAFGAHVFLLFARPEEEASR